MSNVLIIVSSDVVISHRESEEKVYMRCGDETRTIGQAWVDPRGQELDHQIHRTLEKFCGSRHPKDAQPGHRI